MKTVHSFKIYEIRTFAGNVALGNVGKTSCPPIAGLVPQLFFNVIFFAITKTIADNLLKHFVPEMTHEKCFVI